MRRHLLPFVALPLICCICCSDELPEDESFRHTLILTALQADPLSAFGDYLQRTIIGMGAFNLGLKRMTCSGPTPVAVELIGTRRNTNARGEMHLHWVFDADGNSANNCEPGARFRINAANLGADGRSLSRGPLWFEGPSLEARVDPDETLGTLGEIFEDWIQVSGLLRGEGTSVDFGRIVAIWSAESFHKLEGLGLIKPPGFTWLDHWTIKAGMQPDVDRDGDGLERFLDRDGDGRIDECIDGDGTRQRGTECQDADEFVDGFSMSLIFRVEQCELIRPSGKTATPDDPVSGGTPTATLEAGADPMSGDAGAQAQPTPVPSP